MFDVIIIYYSTFDLSLKDRASTTDVFQSMPDPDGVNWTVIPIDMKNLYWGEFMKYYSWDEKKLSTSMVKKLWLKIASDSYRDFVSRIKRMYYGEEKQCKKIQLQEGILESWVAYWELPNVKAKSEQARKNRFSDPVGPGTGYSIHHGGSQCAELYTQIVAKENNRDVSECSIDTHMHLHYKDEKWIGRRAQRVMEEVERRLEELPQPVTRKKRNEVYLEVNHANKKGRTIGQGNLQHYATFSSSASSMYQPFKVVSDPIILKMQAEIDMRTKNEEQLKAELDELKKQVEQLAQCFGEIPPHI